MILDLRNNSELDQNIYALLKNISLKSKKEFNSLIASISESFPNNLDWWLHNMGAFLNASWWLSYQGE